MSVRIGIVSAMEREVTPMLKCWQRSTIRDGSRVYGVWRSNFATYIESGIGREPALLATRALVAGERPDILVSAGFAGALTRDLTVGETITPGTVVDGQTGTRYSTQGGPRVLVSAKAIADESAKKQLGDQFGAEAVDMEAASVAQVAQENGIAFCAVKSISDELGFAMPPFNTYVTAEGKLAIERFAAHIAVRPSYWPSLMQLARNSKKASIALSAALDQLLSSALENREGFNLAQALRELIAGAPSVH
jgi:adenosylhomocysteine nucleosidase